MLVAEGDLVLLASAREDGAVAIGTRTDAAGLQPVAELAGDDPVVVFAAATPGGGPQRLVGVARSDVEQVEAVLRDGTTRELPLNEWRAFSYLAPTPVETAIGLVGHSSDSEVGVIPVPQTTSALSPTAVQPCATCPQTTAVATAEPSYALFERRAGTALTRIDPRTLARVGRPLLLSGYRYGPARSPDGTTLAIAASDRATVELIDLKRLARVASIPLASSQRTTVRTIAWLRNDRLLAVVQRMRPPYGRYVQSRQLVVIDPLARRVVARTPITNKLAINGVVSAGDHLVLLLKPQAPRKSSALRLVIADAEGKTRTAGVEVGRHGSALRPAALVVEPRGRRAFVLVWPLGLDKGRAVEVNLDTLRPGTHTIRLARGTPIRPAGVASLQAVSAGEGHLAATDIIPGPDGRTAGGVFLLDTHTWVARLLDPRAHQLAYRDGQLFTFGPDNLGRPGGTGVTAYDLNGQHIYHSYGERNFARLLFAGAYGHGLPPSAGAGDAFETATGARIGKTAPLNPFRIELVSDASPTARRSTTATAPDRIRAFERPATARDRLPQRNFRWFQQQGTRLLEVREVARYREGRGHLRRLLVARGVDAEGRSVTCQILLQAYGMGSGCSPSRTFFAPGRLVAASAGRLLSGIVSGNVARVEIVGTHGRVHSVALTPDGGFIWKCRAYNGCACVVAELRAYDASGRLVTHQNWRSRSCAKRAPSGVPQQTVTPYRFSTQGRPGTLRPDAARRLFNGYAVEARLLATEAGRAFYRLRRPPDVECYATGKASKLGEIGSMGCPGRPGGQPLVEFGAFSQKRGERPHADRLEGFAADEVATVVAVDEHGNRLAEVKPNANVYVFRPAPRNARKAIALDANGERLPPRKVARVSFPPALLGPRPTRASPSAIKAPVHTGSDRGVEVSAGANGVVVFSATGAELDIAAALHRWVSYGCFRLAPQPWDTESVLVLARRYQLRLALRIAGLPVPFDGCEIQASYGHRWPDRFDSHSAVEVAFTERGRRYFDDRAAARDLALFVRSGEMRQIRRKTGSVLWSLLHARYGNAVVLMPTASASSPVGKIGVWVLGPRTIFSEQSPTGNRLVIELRNGRIVGNNLRQLAKVF
ncbi:MAG TPA: hypothetical protein VFM41_02285 [Gaiella sp.]|nr:hypothetical protein [Gaiella sp.]